MELADKLRSLCQLQDRIQVLYAEGEWRDTHLAGAMKLPKNRAEWPADWKELFEERAGIMEHLALLDRQTAEQQAEAEMRFLAETAE